MTCQERQDKEEWSFCFFGLVPEIVDEGMAGWLTMSCATCGARRQTVFGIASNRSVDSRYGARCSFRERCE